MKNKKEVKNYIIFGIGTTIINIVVYYLLTKISINYQIANVISWVLSVLFAYITNKNYVFKSKEKSTFKLIINFYMSRIATLVIELILMYIFVSGLHLNKDLMKLFVQILIIILNYILSKLLVFNSNKKTRLEKN